MNKSEQYVILKDKKSGTVEDICRIEPVSTGNLNSIQMFVHNVFARLDPQCQESMFESVVKDYLYDPKTARREYTCVPIDEHNLDFYKRQVSGQ